ncbi:oxidoreductase nad-binding rossmann fold protein [Diplodia corticola]|uniref:Oxidoreductase nad-binding rossmann fold protein n=1 Tax=Diplodia corticola TaxID=236234 RepID=A0A1J9RTK1_9PEZI|nr:oxidoreductase nad-binding rossmann fold protein [Diplodia corticola]OJD31196.1 oxidoreductase nad-binding rossmann fold protein [Diplodia corticola]
MSVGVAIIGSGVFVREKHLAAVQAAPSLTLKALFSRSLKSAEALASEVSGVDLYSEDAGEGKGYSDLLARTDIKGVIIALPIPAQPAYIKAALSAGKHVLSEKPVAKDVAEARELLQWYDKNIDKSKVTWGVAENFRFFESFQYGAEKVKELGKVVSFSTKMHAFVKEGSKYQVTSWRKDPTHQGGFVLDAGVHFVAAARLLLSSTGNPTSVSAHTAQHLPYLPPVDTIDAVWKLGSGCSGSFSTTFAAPVGGHEYRIVCERGTVTVGFGSGPMAPAFVAVNRAGDEGEGERKEFPETGFGVTPEVAAWGGKLEEGGFDERQAPQEALKDLQIMEAMLRSGEQGGVPVALQY